MEVFLLLRGYTRGIKSRRFLPVSDGHPRHPQVEVVLGPEVG